VLSVVSAGGAVGVSALQQLQSVVRSLHGINSPEWLSIGGAQRKWFECEHDPYEGGQDIDDRIHRVVNSFLELTHLVRGRNAPSAAGAGS
jgi:azobenzene reductase